jgi:hypothetical protein
VDIGEFQSRPALGTFKPVGVQQAIPIGKGYLYFVVQEVTFRAFVHLKCGVDDQPGMNFRQKSNFVADFIVEKLLV